MAATLVDRFLVKIGIPPKSLVPASRLSLLVSDTGKEVRSIEHLSDIPRYPPFMQGLPVHSPATLLATQHDLVRDIRQIIANDELLDEHYTPAMMRLASLVQLLPASQAHHHRGAGGMLRHSLEVGLWALQQTEGKLIRGVVTPQQRRVIEPRWRLAVFLAGICHDLGKIVTDLTVTDRSNEIRWRPYRQGLYEWANKNGIESYFLHWQEGRGKKHVTITSTLYNSVIQQSTFDWISDGGIDAEVWLTESLNSNPGATNQIHNLVVKADQLSVERDLKSMGVAMAGYEIGVPVERYLTDIMRRLVQEGIWRINEPSARVWNIDGTTYLVWPMAGEEIARRTKDEDIPGLPKTGDGILDMMVEREIAFMRDDESDPFYYIAPDVITEKIPNMRMKAIRLRDQALISSMPIAPIPGKIHSSKVNKESPVSSAEHTGQAELPLAAKSDCSTPVAHVEIAATEPSPPQHVPSATVEHLEVELQPIVEAVDVSPEAPLPLPAAPIQTRLSVEEMGGAMGELMRVLLGEFKCGKKSFDEFGVKQTDGTLYIKWPDTFAGYGFTGKQILDGLTEVGWLIPANDVAKVGDAVFAGGAAKSIKLSPVIGHLFGTASTLSPEQNLVVQQSAGKVPPIIDAPFERTHSLEEVFMTTDVPTVRVKKQRKRSPKKVEQAVEDNPSLPLITKKESGLESKLYKSRRASIDECD